MYNMDMYMYMFLKSMLQDYAAYIHIHKKKKQIYIQISQYNLLN